MEDMTATILEALHRFGVDPPEHLATDRVWVWDVDGDTRHVRSPLPSRMTLSTLAESEAVRLVPLALVPFKHEHTVLLTMKHHPKWRHVLPSAEVGLSAGPERCCVVLNKALEVQAGLWTKAGPEYAGIAVSFKVSPTTTTPTCYLFPFFVFCPTTVPPAWQWTGSDGVGFRLLSRSRHEELVEARGPNSDVYHAIGRLFPAGWSALESRAAALGALPSQPEGVPNDRPSALVSWSHVDTSFDGLSTHRADHVLRLTNELRHAGVDAEVDLYHHNEGVDWTRWGPGLVDQVDFVLIVLSSGWRDAWENRGDPSSHAGASAEADAIRSLYSRNRVDFIRRVRLILLPGSSPEIPSGLHGVARYEVKQVDKQGVEELLRDLTSQPRYQRPPVGNVRVLPPDPSGSEPSHSTSHDGTAQMGVGPRPEAVPEADTFSMMKAGPPIRPGREQLPGWSLSYYVSDDGQLMCELYGTPPQVLRDCIVTDQNGGAGVATDLSKEPKERFAFAYPREFEHIGDLRLIPDGRYRIEWIASGDSLIREGMFFIYGGTLENPLSREDRGRLTAELREGEDLMRRANLGYALWEGESLATWKEIDPWIEDVATLLGNTSLAAKREFNAAAPPKPKGLKDCVPGLQEQRWMNVKVHALRRILDRL